MILAYHNIIEGDGDEFDERAGRVPVDRFRSQMERIARFYRPLSLDEYLRTLPDERPAERSVAVTFDDGFAGVLTLAAPILHDLGIPATIFVVTDYVSNPSRLFTFDLVEIASRLSQRTSIPSTAISGERVSLVRTSDKLAFMTHNKRIMRTMSSARQKVFQRALAERLEVSEDQCLDYARRVQKFTILDWVSLRVLADNGWTVGSHTCSHPALTDLEYQELGNELRRSQLEITEKLRVTGVPFAYPYGKPEHIGPLAPAAVESTGYSCAVTTTPGMNGKNCDLYLLKRISASPISPRRPRLPLQ